MHYISYKIKELFYMSKCLFPVGGEGDLGSSKVPKNLDISSYLAVSRTFYMSKTTNQNAYVAYIERDKI